MNQLHTNRPIAPNDLLQSPSHSDWRTRLAAFGSRESEAFSKGEFIFRPDEPARCLYLLDSGRVKLGAYSDNGREIIKAILKPGEVFGESVILGEVTRTNYALALDGEVKVFPLTLSEFKALIQDDDEFSLQITRMLTVRLKSTEQRLESLVSKDARTRVVDFLLGMAAKSAANGAGEVHIANFFTHRDIASLTATSRQTVTSILNDLREKGIISFDRKHLQIHNIDSLRAKG